MIKGETKLLCKEMESKLLCLFWDRIDDPEGAAIGFRAIAKLTGKMARIMERSRGVNESQSPTLIGTKRDANPACRCERTTGGDKVDPTIGCLGCL